MPTRRRPSPLVAVLVPLALATAAPLEGQIFKVPRRVAEPALWVGGSVGYFQLQDLADSRSNSIWRFGSTVQYRGSLEYSLGRGSSVGVSGSYARMPLVYESLDGAEVFPGGTSRVDAHAGIGTVLATFHAGGGEGFHYVVDLGAGMTRFVNFRTDRSPTRLPPSGDSDFSFTIASGFGYSTSARTELTLVQEYGNVFHQRGTLPNDVRTNAQQLTTRLGVRMGLGTRRAR